MNRDRRIVVSVAVGLALAVVARMTCRLITEVDGGWFMYSPDSGAAFAPLSDSDAYTTAAIWLVSISVWALVSWRLFNHRHAVDED